MSANEGSEADIGWRYWVRLLDLSHSLPRPLSATSECCRDQEGVQPGHTWPAGNRCTGTSAARSSIQVIHNDIIKR